jgi:hypothetical protein
MKLNRQAQRGFGNTMPNTCWECKNNTLKLKVLVPYDRTIKEYMHETGNLQSDIVAVVKEKREQYTVWFRSQGAMRLATFRLLQDCNQNLEKPQKGEVCPFFSAKEDACQISNIIYSKVPMPLETKKELQTQIVAPEAVTVQK